ncbi:putative circadian clock protein, KaiC [Halorhabdus utahensis DSM 12940]|uniref:non-specific serine/threonine protein kinase n=1 Tax=Halorhabdus utahensis (strain DSM 12940 / JCM 11049 / AX-2) TaxID=519442 RepID=C7NVJ6_HALUD|nr:ATPase domain-containing protein [Halorhabdus utahensis]ACV12519.1 putative circadian clock protein, KaiC [Halorhabdus utahensis DSM 12940]
MQLSRLSTGVAGLDAVLDGGLVRGRNVLVRGTPGAGKTIFGLYFLSAGIAADERSLYVNLGEPQAYVEETADAFDLQTEGIHFHNLSPTSEQFAEQESYDVFESAEVDQPDFIDSLRTVVDEVEPDRVLLDPITEFRYLTSDERQFRKGILGLLDYLKDVGATVMLTSQAGETVTDEDLQFLVDGVVSLEVVQDSRAVQVSKFRGSSFRRGKHFYGIDDEGLTVWPRLVPGEVERSIEDETLSSGVPELDSLLGGGIDRGTVTILSGPTGAGKTTTGVQFLTEAALDKTEGVLFQFEEAERTIRKRADAIGIPLRTVIEEGCLSIVEIEPDEYTVGEFEQLIREAVDDGVELVMIDGTQGFKQNLRGLEDPTAALLRVGRYLRSAGVSTILVNEVHNITGDFRATEERTSNLADNLVFLRHVEYRGELRKVIGALKMRTSDFEHSLRELEITTDGICVGDPLPQLRGILTGTPDWEETDLPEDTNGGQD